jgi:enoyl-CoA hydratase/carnithine racemase
LVYRLRINERPKVEPLIYGRDGVDVRLTLNRPETANALDGRLVDCLIQRIDQAHAEGARLLVIDARGSHFCSGFDFSHIEEQGEAELVLRFIRIETLLQRLFHAPFPTMALAHGRAFGAGADLVCACSGRVATPDAKFLMPGPRFGVILGARRLAHRIGWQAAARLIANSTPIDAQEAFDLGLVQAVVPRSQRAGWLSENRWLSDSIDLPTAFRLFDAVTPDTRAQDMASLVESVSRPGLKDRMINYYRQVRLESTPPARDPVE